MDNRQGAHEARAGSHGADLEGPEPTEHKEREPDPRRSSRNPRPFEQPIKSQLSFVGSRRRTAQPSSLSEIA